jgi:nitrite reductase/ring-hydroxylating ferredoxin subunit
MTALHDHGTAAGVDVGSVTDLTRGEGRTYTVGGTQIAVFLLSDGTVRATDATCPHKGGPLADGQFDQAVVVCPLHQYAFAFDTGACTSAGVAPVRTYAAHVVDGRIRLTLG